MRREDRLKVIIDVLADAEMPLPTSKLAGRVGLRVTPYFRGMLHELSQLRIIKAEPARMTNGLPVHLWTLTEAAEAEIKTP